MQSVFSFVIHELWGSSLFENFQNFIYISKMKKNVWKKISLLDNCIWIRCVKLSLLRRKYFSLTVNPFTSSPKILHITKRDLFQLNWPYSDQKIWKKCRSLDFNSAWDRLPCCLWKDLPKPDLLDIRLTTSFAVCNFGDT